MSTPPCRSTRCSADSFERWLAMAPGRWCGGIASRGGRAGCVDAVLPRSWGASHTSDMAVWMWGNGWGVRSGAEREAGRGVGRGVGRAAGRGVGLSEAEKEVASAAFLAPYAKFLRGEEVEWGTEGDPLGLVRLLKSDGSVVVERDEMLAEGLELWDGLVDAGAMARTRGLARL